jgi:hypothetical protein
LAKKAAHVAASGSHAENRRTGQKMIQRLFLDGINLQRSGSAVSQAIKLSLLVGANKAETRLPASDMAVPRTKIAVDLAVWVRFPPLRFVQLWRNLEDTQFRHIHLLLKHEYNPSDGPKDG